MLPSESRALVGTTVAVEMGSEAPVLDAEILSASFEGFGLKWITHADDPEFEARLRAAVRRLLGKFHRDMR